MITIDKIIRSKRKTVAIYLDQDGKVTVRAPLRLSRSFIDRFVEEKADWVLKRQEQLPQTERTSQPHEFRPGELFYFLGVSYPLEIIDRASPRLVLEKNRFLMTGHAQNQASQIFEAWYRREARRHIAARVDTLSRIHGYHVNGLRITGAKTRWGSCGTKGNLNFTWRLIMAPEPAIDYVIIHELAHLEIRNHSRKFWEKVGSLYPDYARQRKWLKMNNWLLK